MHTDEDRDLAKLLFLEGKSVRDVKSYLPCIGVTTLYVWKREAELTPLTSSPVHIKEDVKHNVLAIGDIHAPGHLEGYLEFCHDTYHKYGCDTVMFMGDIVDFHFISRHQSELDAAPPEIELQNAIVELSRWVKVFPEAKLCLGNHDEIPYRQAKTLGIPSSFLKSLNDLLELPDEWVWRPNWTIDDVVYEHGLGSGGMYGAKLTAIKYRRSYVQAHSHSNGMCCWIEGPFDRIFGMQTGCGIDENKYNARYGKSFFKQKTAPGCGVVLNGGEVAFHVPMDLNKYGAYKEVGSRL